ncbi:hypothetical protein C5167_046305 [Papaver somniferum]|uniref:Uncharacterized protein n=1 Tax=Papaver somniferum TaxID=3469 RepID=A0A4Y7LFV1_PAPSO|nr:hypothetical protein C5167_046305 [Papaver somniferum]
MERNRIGRLDGKLYPQRENRKERTEIARDVLLKKVVIYSHLESDILWLLESDILWLFKDYRHHVGLASHVNSKEFILIAGFLSFRWRSKKYSALFM